MNGDLIGEGSKILDRVTVKMQAALSQIDESLAGADTEIMALRARWNEKYQAIQSAYENKLRELQKDKIDGDEFIRLRRQIEELQPLRDRRKNLARDLEAFHKNRLNLIDEWENLLAAEYRHFEKAAKKVSKKLSGRVRVRVTKDGNREPLEGLLREGIGGNLAAFIERLYSHEPFSLRELAQACREGKEALVRKYNAPPASAEKIAQADAALFMKIEELELAATTQIELNTASEGDPEHWQTLEGLSTGQKATAVLLLLLLESDAPLVVDQPEDDLDNRFITEGVVPAMKQEKRKRQFVFSTHNANIPVLGDAELIIGLSTGAQDSSVQGQAKEQHMGSIDIQPVREMVEEILEGGKTAFEMRRKKYGF